MSTSPLPLIYLFEDAQVERLLPLTYARPVCELRLGALTLLERLTKNLPAPPAGLFVRPYLAETVRTRTNIPINPSISIKDGLLLVNARLLLPAAQMPWHIPAPNSAAITHDTLAWIYLDAEQAEKIDLSKLHEAKTLEAVLPEMQRSTTSATLINHPWDLFDHQTTAIFEDFTALGPANHATVMPGVHLLNPEHIHLAKGVKIWPGVVLDAQNGPIIIGENSEVRANAVITGPTAIAHDCIIRTHADIRENCSIGPGSRIGGEVSQCIFLGHSSKQHFGFLGQSIVGQWVNIGAGATTSNLKNTYGPVRMPLRGMDEPTGKQFLGSVIADHVKIAIGAFLSTGSVVGFASHVLSSRPPRFVPSFAWVTEGEIARADFEKIEQIASIAMQRRGQEFTAADHALFVEIASMIASTERFDWPTT